MSERRVEAGVHAGTQLFREADAGMKGNGGAQTQPDEQDRARFEQAMSAEPEPAQMQAKTSAAAPPVSPFALFGAAAAPSPQPAAPSFNLQDAQSLINRLMVSQDGSAAQVRMELNEEHLPGVTAAVYEDGGLLTVDFICRNENSRQLLNQSSAALVQEMAENLNRPVVWRVMTDDEEDLCLHEVQGTPR